VAVDERRAGSGGHRPAEAKEHIRSEILCHGLGAHMMYPDTRTVLDIGGQDTKAIKVDPHGIVENFQMNDRCAAGCGRYLGVINMVSRGISAPNILRGIHGSMADRLAKLIKSVGNVDGVVMMTGGLAHDEGLVAAMQEVPQQEKVPWQVRSHPDSIYAGAIGAAL
jgi:benzoyl-CoA reductase subunit A